MSTSYHDEAGQQWRVDEIAPGGAGSISDSGMVDENSRAASTTLVFRREPDGALRIATDVPLSWRGDKAVLARAFLESLALDTFKL